MKKKLIAPLVFLTLFVLIVSSACSLTDKLLNKETQEPQVIIITATPNQKTINITQEPVVVQTEEPTVEVTEEPMVSDEPPAYFVDEFEGSIDNYWMDIYGPGDHDLVDIYQDDGYLKFQHDGEQLYSYVYYDPYTYTDVRIDIQAENIATNDNSVNIVCRYDENLGWYEYNIDNDGEWTLWYYDPIVYQGYKKLYDGGSTAINMGRDTNLYTVICQGDELSLYINGVLTRTVENSDLKEGMVGFGVSSYYSYPVIINVDWIEISEPY